MHRKKIKNLNLISLFKNKSLNNKKLMILHLNLNRKIKFKKFQKRKEKNHLVSVLIHNKSMKCILLEAKKDNKLLCPNNNKKQSFKKLEDWLKYVQML
jgi:hypothetical protein